MRQPYVSNLLLISERVDPAVIDMWERNRASEGGRVSVASMIELGKRVRKEELSPSDQAKAFRTLEQRARVTKEHQRNSRGVSREQVRR